MPPPRGVSELVLPIIPRVTLGQSLPQCRPQFPLLNNFGGGGSPPEAVSAAPPLPPHCPAAPGSNWELLGFSSRLPYDLGPPSLWALGVAWVAVGAPAPSALLALASSRQPHRGAEPGRLFQGRRLEGRLLSPSPGIPPSGLLGRQAFIHVAARGGDGEEPSPGVSVCAHGAWRGCAPAGRGPDASLSLPRAGDRETETGSPPRRQARVQREWPTCRGVPSLPYLLCPHPPGWESWDPLSGSLKATPELLGEPAWPGASGGVPRSTPTDPPMQDLCSWLPAQVPKHATTPFSVTAPSSISLSLRLSPSLPASASVSPSGSVCLSPGPPVRRLSSVSPCLWASVSPLFPTHFTT